MIAYDDVYSNCLHRSGVTEEFPFGDTVSVFKVMGKIFALLPMPSDGAVMSVSLKCDPQWALLLRSTYVGVSGAYHLNKTHWNGVLLDADVPSDEILEMIEHAYHLVVKSLTKAQKTALKALE